MCKTTLFLMILALLFLPAAAENTLPKHPRDLTYPAGTFTMPIAKDYRMVLPNGLVAYIVSDSTLPIIEMGITLKTGSAADPAGKAGLDQCTANALAYGGSTAMPGEAFTGRLDMLGAAMDVKARTAHTTIYLSGLSRDRDVLLGMFADVLISPAFPEEILAVVKANLAQQAAQQAKSPRFVAETSFRRLLYGANHPMARAMSPAGVQALTRQVVSAYYRRMYTPKNAVLFIAGDFERAELTQQLKSLFADWRGDAPQRPDLALEKPAVAPGVYLLPMPVHQATILIGHAGVSDIASDLPAIQVMDFILGGGSFTSRIMSRVRSDEGLAYTAYAVFDHQGPWRGLFKAFTQTKSASVPFAIQLILKEMETMRTSLPSAKEMDTAVNSIRDSEIGHFNTHCDTVEHFAYLEALGLPADLSGRMRRGAQAVTAKDVQKMAQQYVHPEDLVILVVGDPDQVQAGDGVHPVGLKDFGTITQLPPFTL